MREIFQRIEENNIVSIEVNIHSFAYSNVNPWLLSVFVKFDVLSETHESYEELLETKESLIIALEHNEVSKYVGSRMIDGWCELYFYAQESKSLDALTANILSSTSYVYESSIVRDSKWDFHYKNLKPSELELCHIESEKIIFLLKEEGDTLETSREVEHYISFELPTQKNRFVNTLELDGFTIKDDIATDEFEHGVALVKEHAVTSDVMKSMIEILFVQVKKAGGYYEGWSTTLVEDSDV